MRLCAACEQPLPADAHNRQRFHQTPECIQVRNHAQARWGCRIDGCPSRVRKQNLCDAHYRRLVQYGDPEAGPPIRRTRRRRYEGRLGAVAATPPANFWAQVDQFLDERRLAKELAL